MKQVQPFDTHTRERLTAFLADAARPPDTLSYFALCGFLFEIHCVPEMVRPSEWLPMIFGDADPCHDSLEQAQQFMADVMALYNHVGAGVNDGDPHLPDGCTWESSVVDNIENDRVGAWSLGFALAEDWLSLTWPDDLPKSVQDALEVQHMVLTFFANRQIAEELVAAISQSQPVTIEELTSDLRADFNDAMTSRAEIGLAMRHSALPQQRGPVRSSKVGRNVPCPCGSGRKYKKCCGAATRH